ncbi:SH3 domain-containing protein [Stenomitos frigidus]|uniref:SH3 domain-containing protein n=1 Tax=Stenomitos frigidus ULC18 TaxID=2107698 RepID=A0A2T1DZP2_9CYAN|nr:SH3 domain-containing protein [Stenomitos frigidus]PSB25968.1 SH3 domain-containing protein [Stenomitos frigidus ULC18]
MSWADLVKVLSGVFLAIALMVGGCFFAAQYVIAQFTAPPPRPTFPNDNATAKPKAQPKPSVTPVATQASPQPSVSPKPSPKPSETVGFRARITLSQGLNLRESPSRDAARIGGVASNARITVLEESPDREWQRVRLEGGREGWVKAGYTERVNQ